MSSSTNNDLHQRAIAIAAMLAIFLHILLAYFFGAQVDRLWSQLPLLLVLIGGGLPLVFGLVRNLLRAEFGADLLAGISIVVSLILGEYLAGTLVVLMLSGGQALEMLATRRASRVLQALAKRVPTIAHRREGEELVEIPVSQISIGDTICVLPHQVCPVDGVVIEGHGSMDEAYLTGEPYRISKTPGSDVISGAINGPQLLLIRANRLAVDSRYAKIMEVMQRAEQQKPRLRRLGDQLGALYTPVALGVAVIAWLISGEVRRFLAVLVVATPCPLLLAIPIAIIGAISLAARRGIIIKDAAILERLETCRTIIFDKTGTLTYGEPTLVAQDLAAGFNADRLLQEVASLERYSKHPLSQAVQAAAQARGLPLLETTRISEPPGQGLKGIIAGREIFVTSRKKFQQQFPEQADQLPVVESGLECVILVEGKLAGVYRFCDTPRADSVSFVGHLGEKHGFNKIMLVSGDRASEVQSLAERVGIKDVVAGASPEEKLDIVRREIKSAPTLFVGDGINDAPALLSATVGVALGQNSEVTAEAAGAVILDPSLRKVDELLHIARRMRKVALQSAVGGMLLSFLGMILAGFGVLSPVWGAVVQEMIDVLAIVNALRVAEGAEGEGQLTDFGEG